MGHRGSQRRGRAFGNEPFHGAIQDEETWDREALEDRKLMPGIKLLDELQQITLRRV